jgi:hypothetical protein
MDNRLGTGWSSTLERGTGRAMMAAVRFEEGAIVVKSADKPKKPQKKTAQKTLKEKRSEKRAKEAQRQ